MAQADYTLALGRLLTVTVLEELKESYGDGLDAVGPVLVGPEAKPRPFSLTLPVSGNGHRTDWYEAGRRLRRQVHGLMENTPARMEGLYLRWDVDPESNGWLLVGGGDLEAQDGGVTFADWKLTLTDCYRVGSLATHRQARRGQMYDRRAAGVPLDTLRRVYGAVFTSVTPLPLIYLPAGASDVTGYNGRLPKLGANSVQDAATTAPVVADASAGEVFSFERPESSFGIGDVVVYNRLGAGGLVSAGHSISAGYGLPTPATDCWPSQLRYVWPNVPYRQLAVNGSVSCWDAVLGGGALNGYVDYLQKVTRPTWGSLVPQPAGSRNAHSFMWGINDLDTLGYANPTPSVEAHRTVICRARQCVWCGESDGSVSFGTGWTTVTTTQYNSGSAFRTCNASGRTVTITVPAAYKGSPLDLLYIVAAGDAASVAVSVTGATTLSTTHTLNGTAQCAAGSRNGITRRLTTLNPGAHTITLTFNSVSGTPGFNGWGVEAQDPPRCLLPNTPRQPAYFTQAYFGVPFVPTDDSFPPWNAALQALTQEFTDGRVLYVDVDSVFNKRPEFFQADALHYSYLGASVTAQECARALSPEEVMGPAQPLDPDDLPSVENGRVRVRLDTTGGVLPPGTGPITMGLAVDTNYQGAWVEAGMFMFQRGFLQVARLISAQVVEVTPEKAILKAVMATDPLDASSREEIYVTLARGWSGPRVEWYAPDQANGTDPTPTITWVHSQANVTDSAMKINSGGGATCVSSVPGGSPWTGVSMGAMTGEPEIALYRLGLNVAQTQLAVHQLAAVAATSQDATAYGANLSGLAVSVVGNYVSVFAGFHGLVSNLFMDAEAMTLGAGTTNTAVAGSNNGNAARGTRTTDANAHVTQATWPTGRSGVFRVFARVKTSASTLNVYAKSVGGGGTTGATKTTTSASYVWVDLGDIACFAGTLEIHAWASAAATFDVDCVQAFKLEDRTPTVPTYDGSRDLGAWALYDSRAVPALVAR